MIHDHEDLSLGPLILIQVVEFETQQPSKGLIG